MASSSSQETKGDGGEAWSELYMNSRQEPMKRADEAAKRGGYPDRLYSHRLLPAPQRGPMPQHVPNRVCNLGSRTITNLEVVGPFRRAPPFAAKAKLDETNRADE